VRVRVRCTEMRVRVIDIGMGDSLRWVGKAHHGGESEKLRHAATHGMPSLEAELVITMKSWQDISRTSHGALYC
jgi:hypothetical protein